MNGVFKLEIRLGNDTMRTYDHLAGALRTLAKAVNDGYGCAEGRLRDDNGNTVGEWSIVEEEDKPQAGNPLAVERRPYTVKELADMPTIDHGHCDNLKIDDGDYRVWLSRLTRADGYKGPLVSYQIRVCKDGWVDCDPYGRPVEEER